MNEQRKYERTNKSTMVEISHPSIGVLELKGKDLSDGGAYVFLGNHRPIPVGTVVKARIKRHIGFINLEPTDMQVVHQYSGGMGMMFV
ncbi:MAG: hypothetical protein ACI89U_002796 [Gammaproteobacteria bacterium]|jgi:hypothetical protein